MIRLIRILGIGWLYVAAGLIISGYLLIWYFRGFSELLAIASPTNITNFFAVVVALAPGWLLIRLSERLARRRHDRPILIEAPHSLQAIPIQYGILEKMFGARNKDWQVLDRCVEKTADGRHIETYKLQVGSAEKHVKFDITKCIAGDSTPEAQNALKTLEKRNDFLVPALVPKEELFTLQTIILNLSDDDLAYAGIFKSDKSEIVGQITKTMILWKTYENMPESLTLTLRLPEWVRLKTLLSKVRLDASNADRNLLLEEEIENLKAVVEDAVKRGMAEASHRRAKDDRNA